MATREAEQILVTKISCFTTTVNGYNPFYVLPLGWERKQNHFRTIFGRHGAVFWTSIVA